jgi:hypothetical protein
MAMEIWIPLIAAVIGGLIATIPVIISNRAQAKEREKDRQEQRREAKIQVREKWIERDILTVMSMIESLSKLDVEHMVLDANLAPLKGKKDQQSKIDVMKYLDEADRIFNETQHSLERLLTLGSSLDDVRIFEKLGDYLEARNKYVNADSDEDMNAGWTNLGTKSGDFHRVLREKLISIRDT